MFHRAMVVLWLAGCSGRVVAPAVQTKPPTDPRAVAGALPSESGTLSLTASPDEPAALVQAATQASPPRPKTPSMSSMEDMPGMSGGRP